jgi:hypothetical protein
LPMVLQYWPITTSNHCFTKTETQPSRN